MARTLIFIPKKHKICVDGKIKTAYIMLLNKSVNDDRVEKKLPASFRVANLAELKAFQDITLQTKNFIVALGSNGPFPYAGKPALMPGGEIVSLGLPSLGLKWSKGTRMLVVKN